MENTKQLKTPLFAEVNIRNEERGTEKEKRRGGPRLPYFKLTYPKGGALTFIGSTKPEHLHRHLARGENEVTKLTTSTINNQVTVTWIVCRCSFPLLFGGGVDRKLTFIFFFLSSLFFFVFLSSKKECSYMAENERDTDGIRTFGVAIHKKIVLFLCKSLCYWKVFAPTYGSKPLRINLGNEIVTSSFGVFLSFVFFLLEMNVAFRNTKVFQIWSCCNIEYTTAISSICVLLGVVVSISVFAYFFSEKRSCHMASGYIMMIKIKIINYMKKINFGLKKKIQKMEENMERISKLYSSEDDEVTEERLFDYLLLHPTGYIDKKNVIMNSAIAEKYYRMGYITKGVGDDFRQQYRLTSFGLSQIELAMSLILLS